MKSKYYLGLDIAVVNHGVAVINERGIILEAHSLVLPVSNTDLKRFLDYSLLEKILHKIDSDYKIEAVAIEGYSMMSKGNKRIQAVEIGTLARMHYLYTTNNLYEVSPMSLKKFACGDAKNRSKEAMVSAVRKKFKYKGTDHNIADAIALANYARLSK